MESYNCVSGFFHLACFPGSSSQHNICNVYQTSFFFKWMNNIQFLCDYYNLFIHSFTEGHLNLLAIVSSAALKMHVCISVFNSFGVYA